MIRPEGTKTGRAVSWPVLTALFLAPLLVVLALLTLVRGDDSQIQAAIVNLDEGTTVATENPDGTTDEQFVPMGRQLAAEMIDRPGENVTWTLADEASATEGIDNGDYAAVVTIPANFSDAAMSFSENDGATARRARINVDVSQNAPVTDAVLAQEIARIATTSLNSTLTEQYLGNIYLGFNSVGEQFGQIVDGAEQLDSGAGQLAEGSSQAAGGATELSDGLDQLASGSQPLRDGGNQLSTGAYGLTDGAVQLAHGAEQLDAGVQEMAGQMPQLVDGVGQLADGAEQLLPGVAQYTEGTAQALGGVGEIKGGLDQVIEGLDSNQADLSELQELVDGSAALAEGSQQVSDGVQQLNEQIQPLDGLITDDMIAGVEQLQQQASGLGDAVVEADQTMQGYADGSLPLPQEVTDFAAELKAQFECTVDDQALCEVQQQMYNDAVDQSVLGGFQAGAAAGSEFLNSTDPETGQTYIELSQQLGEQVSQDLGPAVEGMRQAQQIVPGIGQLADGAQDVADGNAQLAAGIDQMATQLPEELNSQLGELSGGLKQISAGAGTLIEQSQPLITNGEALAAGSNQLLGGIRELNSQVGALPGGVQQLADGTSQLSSGASQLSDGLWQYHGGVVQYVDGVWQFTSGVDQVAEGADGLSDGLVQLDEGVGELSDGLGEFSSQLSEGAEQMPHYSAEDITGLSETVASPVSGTDTLSSLAFKSLGALILVCGLWLAGLAAFVVSRPVPSNIVTSGASSLRVWLGTVGAPAVVVAALGAVSGAFAGVIMDLSLTTTLGLIALLVLLGVSFTLAQHALAGWLGHIGRGIALVLLAITVALGLSSAVPQWLSVFAGLSPLHSGLLLIRGWVAGDNMVSAIAMTLFIAVLMAVASWAVVGSRRQMKVAQFKALHASATS